MKTLTADTRRVLEGLHIEAIPLIDISVRDGDDIRHLYISNRFIKVGSNYYLDLLTEQGGVSDISYDLDGPGGIATISAATIRLQNATQTPDLPLSAFLARYELIGQAVTISYVFPPSTEVIGVWSGKIVHMSVKESITFELQNTSLDDIRPMPTKIAGLAEYPNLALQHAGQPIPLIFGSLSTTPVAYYPEKTQLAQCICTDVLNMKFTPGARCERYGDVYYWDGSDRRFYGTLTKTQSGEIFTLANLTNQTAISPPESWIGTHSILLRDIWTLGFTDLPEISSPEKISGLSVYIEWDFEILSAADAPTQNYNFDFFLAVQYEGNTLQSFIIYGCTQFTNGQVYVPANDETYLDHTFTITPPTDFSWDTISDIRIKTDAYAANGFYGGRPVPEFTTNQLNINWTLEKTEAQAFPHLYQAVTGYVDRVANYTDGGVINTNGMVLTSPIDVVHALMRDEDYGMGIPSAQIDRSDIDEQRQPTHRRFDFSLNEQIGFDTFSDLIMQGQMYMHVDANNKWKIRTEKKGVPVAAFTHLWNIYEGSFSVQKTPLRDVKNHFFLRYGYSSATKSYAKSLIRSGTRRGAGQGNLLSDGMFYVTTASMASPAAVGDRLWFNGWYYIVIEIISSWIWRVRRENGDSIVAMQNQAFHVGPHFDLRCYESEQAYGRKAYRGIVESAIESKFIQDDATARSYLNHLIDYHAYPVDVVSISTGLSAIDLDVGDEIIVDHPYRTGIEEIGTLSSILDWYSETVSWNLNSGVTVTEDDYILLQKGVYFEVLQSGGGTSVTRGQMNSIPRRWPLGTSVYRALPTSP